MNRAQRRSKQFRQRRQGPGNQYHFDDAARASAALPAMPGRLLVDPDDLDDLEDRIAEASATPAEHLEVLGSVDAEIRDWTAERAVQVSLCRTAGSTWAEIGGVLGITKQAAQRKYGSPDGDAQTSGVAG